MCHLHYSVFPIVSRFGKLGEVERLAGGGWLDGNKRNHHYGCRLVVVILLLFAKVNIIKEDVATRLPSEERMRNGALC